MDKPQVTLAMVSNFTKPDHETVDVLIAQLLGYHVIAGTSAFTWILCDGYTGKLVVGTQEDAWRHVPHYAESIDLMTKVIGDYSWSSTATPNGNIQVVMAVKRGAATVMMTESTLAFALAKAWLVIQASLQLAESKKEPTVIYVSPLIAQAERLIKVAIIAKLSPQETSLIFKGTLDNDEMAALDKYASERGQVWAKTEIDKVNNTTHVWYAKPYGNGSLTSA